MGNATFEDCFRQCVEHTLAPEAIARINAVHNDAHHIPSVWVGLGGVYEDGEKISSHPRQFPGADRDRVVWSGTPPAISAEVEVQVPISDEMMTAGLDAALRCGWIMGDHATQAIYRAMRPLERSGAMTVRDHQALEQMRRERDEARVECANRLSQPEVTALVAARDNLIDRVVDSNSALAATNERLRDEIAALTAEKNALADKLTPFLADVETKPKPPVHNPFREFGGDRRRIGS